MACPWERNEWSVNVPDASSLFIHVDAGLLPVASTISHQRLTYEMCLLAIERTNDFLFCIVIASQNDGRHEMNVIFVESEADTCANARCM